MKRTLAQWVDLASHEGPGRVRAASRLMSIIQDNPACLPRLFHGMSTWPEPRLVMGITGPPGAGKSTLVDQLIGHYRERFPERKLGIIAVDPSSPFTGGAVLGDRVRMMRHANDDHVFIRSLASRGHLGGLTLGIKGICRIMGLAGCDLVLLETVGVGQNEAEVFGVADFSAIVLAPGQGDDIQMLKAGLMEAGDLFIINKADRDGADRMQSQLMATLRLTSSNKGGRMPDIRMVSALEDRGLDELLDLIEARLEQRRTAWQETRRDSVRAEVRQAILQEAQDRLHYILGKNGELTGQIERVLAGDVSIESLAGELLVRTARQQQED